jgi:threonine dehydratase
MIGMRLVEWDDIERAAGHLKDVALCTPLLAAPWAGPDLWLKPENLQPIGAFKIRGAYNAMACMSAEARARGVVTHSSGNHGRALAYAARLFGVPATIVMPVGSPRIKIDAVRALGAEVVMVPPAERLPSMLAIVEERGMSPVPPFDHLDVIAGQGTIAAEILSQMPDVEVILVPVGGGGLASGVSAGIKSRRPEIRVIGVEPEFAAETQAGLRGGELRHWSTADTYRTMADGVRTAPSPLTFAHLQAYLDDIVTVTEEQIGSAVGYLGRDGHLVVEPSGALGVAAYRYRRDALPAGRTVAVLTGGNLDPERFAELIVAPPLP